MTELPVNQIICEDCLNLMKDWPDKCVDLILTSPPYNAKNIGYYRKSYDIAPMQIPENKYAEFCRAWFIEAKRISGGNIILIPGISNEWFYPRPTWVLCRHKPSAVSYNRLGGYNAWEPILVYAKLAPQKRMGQDYILCDIQNFTKKNGEKLHPCPFPEKLVFWLLELFSKENTLVVDCFNGIGTTCAVAKKMNRKWIGIDISNNYCSIARQRLEAIETGVPVIEQRAGQQALFPVKE